MNSKIVLNLFPITFEQSSFEVFQTAYVEGRDRDLAEQLKGYGVWRDGDKIYIWKRNSGVETADSSRFEKVELDVNSNPKLVSKMIREAIHAMMDELEFTKIPGRFGDFTFTKFTPTANFISADKNYKIDERVGIFPRVIIETFFTSFSDSMIYGLLVDFATINKLEIPMDEFYKLGIDCSDLYVKLMLPENSQIESDLSLFNGKVVGKFKALKDRVLELSEVKEGFPSSIDPKYCFPEPTRNNINRYLLTVHEKDYKSLRNIYYRSIENFVKLETRYKYGESLVQRLVGRCPLEISDKLKIKISPNYYSLSNDKMEFKSIMLLNPQFCFDYASKKMHNRPDDGLNTHGPYDAETFSQHKELKVLVISPENFKGSVENFVKQLENGIKTDQATFQKGFTGKYRLKSTSFNDRYFPLKEENPGKSYKEFCLQTMKEASEYDLALIIITEQYKKLEPRDNPYYIAKSVLLNHKIPVQDITIEKIKSGLYSLQYILNNLSLACYAKIGGTPWVLRAKDTVRPEFIIGVDTAEIGDSKLAQKKRIVGYTTMFKSNGDYLLGECIPHANFDEYDEKLKETIVNNISFIAGNENYNEGAELRLIFHVFKNTGKKEVLAVTKAIEELGRYKIEYALVHINTTHNFKLFDKLQSGTKIVTKQDGTRISISTNYIPQRKLMVAIGPRERLINLTGPMQYKGRGCPAPLRVTLNANSTFKDIDYLCQQIYEFSFMSWRGFFPSTEPVTLLYSHFIAKMNGYLEKVEGWSGDVILTSFKDKLWFI